MPRITRKQQKVFAVNATNNGVFGSLQANDPVHSQDPDVIQGRTAYSNGWDDATYSAEKLPPLEEFQALQYLFSRQIAYIMQEGIPEWDTNTTYYKGALVKAIQSDGSFILYASLVDNNQGNLVTDTTKWIITNTSTNFHQGIPNWRADVIYSAGDWVKAQNGNNWAIFESLQNNNLNNAITDEDYWTIKPFTSSLVLFTPQWFDYEIEDVSWLRADTFSWQDGTVYSEAYNHLVADYNGGTSQTETVGSYTITYVLATDGHKITTDETNVANIYNESGVAWYYILDTANQRFKLPRENPIREELKDFLNAPVVGNGGPIKLTNSQNNASIGNLTQLANLGGVGYGLQSSNKASTNTVGIPTSGDSGMVADLSNSTKTSFYKGKQYLYFYVGQFSQSATEQTAGLNSELFNGKVDLNAANLSTQGKSLISGLGMPSNHYDELTLGASGATYTAPANGYFVLRKGQTSAGQYVNISINSILITGFTASGTLAIGTGYIPVKKNDVLKVDYNAGGNTSLFRFIYAEGEPNV